MKNSTIELLHMGKRRKVDKEQYNKLRQYNKISSSRFTHHQNLDYSSSNLSVTSRTNSKSEISQENLQELNDHFRRQAITLAQENSSLIKHVKKCEKLDRLILKKFPQLGQTELDLFSEFDESENLPLEESKPPNLKDIELMLQFKLALDVIELEESLEEREELLKRFVGKRKREHEQEVIDGLFREKIRFLTTVYGGDEDIQTKMDTLVCEQEKVREMIKSTINKQKQSKKSKQSAIKKLQDLEYELKQVQHYSEQRKSKLRKNSREYIQIENGELKSQEDIQREVKKLKDKRKSEGESLQQYLEEKMLEKISMINQIEKMEELCKRIGLYPGRQ